MTFQDPHPPAQLDALDTEAMRADLIKVLKYRMPYGKYKHSRVIDLPEPYLVWFSGRGFPKGELGRILSIVYVIKLNGLEELLKPLQQAIYQQDSPSRP